MNNGRIRLRLVLMVSLSNTEEDLVETLVECLAHAIQRHEEVEPADLNKTIIQKFVYLAVQEFDLSLTYSWYLAGSLVESDTASPSSLSTALDELPTPTEPSVEPAGKDDGDDPDREATSSLQETSTESTDQPVDIQREFEMERQSDPHIGSSEADKLEDFEEETFELEDALSEEDLPTHSEIPVAECVEYFQQELDIYPLHPTDRFLQQFYKYHAPEPYQTLYMNCLHVRSSLRTLQRTVQAHVNGTDPAVDLEQIEDDLNRHISRVHLELADIDHLKGTLSGMMEGTDIIEETVLKLKKLAPTDHSQDHVDAVSQLQTFYFQWVWKYPALRISARTATGPSANRIKRSRTETFDSFESKLTERCETIRRELDAVGLRPDYQDYPDIDQTSTNEAIVDFTNAYFDE